MYQPKDGFLLVEWMLQFLLLTTISVLSYTLITSWYRAILKMNRVCTELLPIYIATDIIRSDIHQAEQKSVRTDNGNLIDLLYRYNYIRWYCKQDKLIRSISSYDITQQRWLKPAQSLTANHLTSGSCILSESSGDQLQCSIITLKTGCASKEIKLVVMLRNGLIV